MTKKKSTRKVMKPAKKKKKQEPVTLKLWEIPLRIEQIRREMNERRKVLVKEQRVFEKERDRARRKFNLTGKGRKTQIQEELNQSEAVYAALGLISKAIINEDDEDWEDDD